MEKKTVQRVYEAEQLAKLDLIEAETALLLAACEEFQTYQATKKDAEDVSARFAEVWEELTSRQQNKLRPELWGDAAKYIEAPRKRRDMTRDALVEACGRRGFTLYSKGIRIRPNETVGFVYQHNVDGTVLVNYRESLKRAIKWAKIGR